MCVVVNKHSTFFRAGMFFFLEESFIMNTFCEAEDGNTEEQPCQGITEPMEMPDLIRKSQVGAS